MKTENNTYVESNTLSQPSAQKIIKLSTGTKVLYCLFNFFAPIASAGALIYKGNVSETTAVLAFVVGFVAGTFCLLWKWAAYSRFLRVEGKELFVCRGEIASPEILACIQVENNDVSWSGALALNYNGKKVKLLDAYPAWIAILCVLGWLVWIPIVMENFMQHYLVRELYKGFPQLFSRAPKNVSKGAVTASTVLMWVFTGYIVLSGLFAVVMVMASYS